MRIIGGPRKGLRLTDVGKGDSAAHLRPTSDRVRESLFNLLINGGYGDPITGARVLDVFAGTGALGLEALSRGSGYAALVDNGRAAGRLIAENIAKARFEGEAVHLRRDARRLGANTSEAFDLVFLDPPYGKGLVPEVLTGLKSNGWLSDDALIVVEDAEQIPMPEGFELRDRRTYGSTQITIMRMR